VKLTTPGDFRCKLCGKLYARRVSEVAIQVKRGGLLVEVPSTAAVIRAWCRKCKRERLIYEVVDHP
jgi:hypothetical protein